MVPHQCGGTDNCGGFNTQPPEGGWDSFRVFVYAQNSFNTQPPEGGWWLTTYHRVVCCLGFNTQPPEGGWIKADINNI